jgi:hypothetical protein
VVVVGVDEGLDLLHEGQLVPGESELHSVPSALKPLNLTTRQISAPS